MNMPMETVHVWFGLFRSQERFDAYMAENESEEEETEDYDPPVSAFVADQSQSFCDHDWLQVNFCESGDLRELIGGASITEDYVETLLAAATALGVQTADSLIMIDAEEIDAPKSVNGDGYTLWYLGSYSCFDV